MFEPKEIAEFQRALAQAGHYRGPVDGIESRAFKKAVISFKRSLGFRARYYIGPLTRKALQAEAKGGLVPWMVFAHEVKGLHERRDVKRLRAWFTKSVRWIDPRDTPWCGAFVATVIRKWAPGAKIPDNPLGARNWGDYGERCAPQVGAVLVFWRGSRKGWKGHVGFYVGEDDKYYHILGGNQGDKVSITRVRKSRFLAARWPMGYPQRNHIVHMDHNTVPVTENEA